jgi:hypothetical protein
VQTPRLPAGNELPSSAGHTTEKLGARPEIDSRRARLKLAA